MCFAHPIKPYSLHTCYHPRFRFDIKRRMTTALNIQGLRKTYDNGFTALKGIDLRVEQGDFFALLGPNGAGKSTTIGILSSLVNKSEGKVSIFSYDLDTQREQAKAQIGLVPQEFNFNIWEPVLEIVLNQGGYYGIPRKEAAARAEPLLKQLGETPPDDCPRPDSSPALADPRRTDCRGGHRNPPYHVGFPAQTECGRHHHHPHHPLPGGGGKPVP